jgi:ferric-dicitrate binding protein FerR (iron transport regulator)
MPMLDKLTIAQPDPAWSEALRTDLQRRLRGPTRSRPRSLHLALNAAMCVYLLLWWLAPSAGPSASVSPTVPTVELADGLDLRHQLAVTPQVQERTIFDGNL